MCGRFTLTMPLERIAERFRAAMPSLHWNPRYNICPTERILAVRKIEQEPREIVPMQWGLVPHWATDPKTGYRMINARSETILEKPAYRGPFGRRRCLIPADGFYEWKRVGKVRQPYHFRVRGGALFAIAGLWDRWRNEEGEALESCTLITCAPNALMLEIHDRMPVILPEESWEDWLATPVEKAKNLVGLLKPYPADEMSGQAVRRLVNSTENDSPECILPPEP